MKEEKTMTKYTSGPWRAYLAGSEGVRILPDVDDIRERGKLIGIMNGRDLLTDQANARLIAAAPEMAEALEMCRRILLQTKPSDDYTEDAISRAHAALQKAGLL